MTVSNTLKHTMIKGTLVLTMAGLISRFMGFFFRIFLSHAFGEENVGLYQLIFPVYTLCLSLGTAGIETALSHITAKKISLGKKNEAQNILYAAIIVTVILSLIQILIIQKNAAHIAHSFLGDERCVELLIIISYALPCASVHCCICGCSFGMQQTRIPALSQLIEQSTRILTVILLFFYLKSVGEIPSIHLAVVGIVAGEFASALYSARSFSHMKMFMARPSFSALGRNTRELLMLSAPLTANRTAVTLLQSIEAASIPASLRLFGCSSSEALSIYGVLTGMALPCILFPSAITSSVGTMLTPAVTTAVSTGTRADIKRLTARAAGSCFILGLFCCLCFLLTGNLLGDLVFHSSSAGKFILTLAWICPFLYTNTALISTINGLGKTTATFLINTSCLTVRILSVYFIIPLLGIQGYLLGLLASQIMESILALAVLSYFQKKPEH